MKAILLFFALIGGMVCSVSKSGMDTNLRGISIVSHKKTGQAETIWTTGSAGVVLRSIDSGITWERLSIPAGEHLDFRGVQAFSADVAYLMSSGEGEKSRIYKTIDGGKNWELQYTDKKQEFFLDAIACVSSTKCYALGDPVDGKFLLLRTEDGKNWKEVPREKMPAALPKEGAFAASNSSLLVDQKKLILFATGGPEARVFQSRDAGKKWTVAKVPMASGKASQGIFSLARIGDLVVAVGGDYENPEYGERSASYSLDTGKNWLPAKKMPGGYRSSATRTGSAFIAVGPTGADVSRDGANWVPVENIRLNAVEFAKEKGWGIGAKGVIVACEKK